MLGIFISSFLFIEKRSRIVEVFSEDVQKHWNEWELRVLVLLSLLLQVILIFFGNRRKYIAKKWVHIILWLSYLSADMVATTALGALSRSQGKPSNTELMALWAPFLLLHLGGPDTITAYSLEDNELWLRHFLGLAQQVGIAIYVLVKSWAYTRVSILTGFMFIPGIVKYGERTWVLMLASKKHFRNSMLDPPDPGPNYAQFMKDYVSEQAKGYEVSVEKIEEVELQMGDNTLTQHEEAQQQPNPSDAAGNILDLSYADVLPQAYHFFFIFKRLFADLILSGDDWEESRKTFQGMSSRRAFKVIEMELGLIYDLLYSKAALVYSNVGLFLRCITLLSIITLLVAFWTGDKHLYMDSLDIIITYILFIGAFILEICAIFILISSDWAFLWLRKHDTVYNIRPVLSNALKKIQSSRKRWSNLVAQYNLISVSVKYTPPKRLPEVQKLLGIDELLEQYHFTYSKEIHLKSKALIFKELKRKSRKVVKIEDVKNLCTSRGGGVLEKNIYLQDKLQWSLNDVEFDQSILLWHIATDLCYECDDDISPLREVHRETSKLLSDYMLYLLIMCPFMLPEGIGQIRFRDTREEAVRFVKDTNSELDKFKVCKKLLEVNTDIRPIEVKGEKSKSVLFDACRLAKTLQSFPDASLDKWEIISLVWIEMLSYAASQCKRTNHAQQLRRGGEFITHIWLLMAHLGMTELFSKMQVKAMLISA